ncbi:MAG: sulfite exporter TauE/SafE family protein [Candidatus Margulisiibacteriota bacterium]|jgi:hypothetical protein
MTIVLIGLLTGFLSGLLGIGGGSIAVPAMIYWLKTSQHVAQGTTLLIIIPTALAGAYIYGKNNQLDIQLAVIIMVAAVIGGLIGASCAQFIPDATLKRLFGVFMMVVGLQMLFSK